VARAVADAGGRAPCHPSWKSDKKNYASVSWLSAPTKSAQEKERETWPIQSLRCGAHHLSWIHAPACAFEDYQWWENAKCRKRFQRAFVLTLKFFVQMSFLGGTL
jgi:hypothetical protein